MSEKLWDPLWEFLLVHPWALRWEPSSGQTWVPMSEKLWDTLWELRLAHP